MIYEVTIADKTYKVELARGDNGWHCTVDGRDVPLDVISIQPGTFSILIDGRSYEVKQEDTATESRIVVGHERFSAVVRDPRSFRSRSRAAGGAEGVKKITAPMPGKVVRILSGAGSRVEAGQGVVVIEAMKMQNELKSPKQGVVKNVHATEGAAVEAGQVLAEIE